MLVNLIEVKQKKNNYNHKYKFLNHNFQFMKFSQNTVNLIAFLKYINLIKNLFSFNKS